jgi:hypothetical protein
MSKSIRNIATLGLVLLMMLSVAAVAAVAAPKGGGGGGGGIGSTAPIRLPNDPQKPITELPDQITPKGYSGNFVSSNDQQVCYDLANLGAINEFAATEDMAGFRVDPPANYTSPDGLVSVTLSPDGKFISWQAEEGVVMNGIIVKGSTTFNVYDYTTTGLLSDAGLGAPLVTLKGKTQSPQISHYNVCYTPPVVDEFENGCTPGYWRNHADRWAVLESTAAYDATFGLSPPYYVNPTTLAPYTLGYAIWAGGGANELVSDALARHSTAALLNAYGGVPDAVDANGNGATVSYKYTPEEVISMVQAAVASGDVTQIQATKDLFQDANESGCPLEGTKAVKVPL